MADSKTELRNETKQKAESERGLDGGKFLTFFLAEEEYGLEILKVQTIIGMMDVTPMPRTPDFVKGVINLRGQIIPVIDLRLKFAMESVEHTSETCVIVVQVANEQNEEIIMGVIVDRVSEVMDISSEQIEETPEFGIDLDTEFILGIGKIADKVVILLDVDKVMSASEVVLVEKAVKKKEKEKEKKGDEKS